MNKNYLFACLVLLCAPSIILAQAETQAQSLEISAEILDTPRIIDTNKIAPALDHHDQIKIIRKISYEISKYAYEFAMHTTEYALRFIYYLIKLVTGH